ncbi:hypothetical protein Back11_02580 [Paenibacillus baekrokdamisoli]|uniref:Uncharacterized protein n=1 Tax=Paenibacillus baekrokdamisoli TaxID=1712516 RepID=A0A3G9J2J5_9BACL|nr:hypothetical protein [Paenibacillus baekrokdamisoli]MBB3072628.1 hypothetical protein [Paenibacillus baekrokdamisoli]BBH18913.1 hypothetical protein Back11_02580 [Paenibacillus baekrokdamisoli]
MADAIISGELAIIDIINVASTAKDPAKATCMEAFEYATNKKPVIANMELFRFAQNNLCAKATRLKWESAKVVGNIAHLYSEHLEETIASLLENTKNDGTVVRWSAAYALTQIFHLPNYSNDDFRTTLQDICEFEEKNSIKKIYLKVLKR